MRRITLFLLSSFLTPATLAAGQATCVLATQMKVMTPLPADSTTGLTLISNGSGSCVARPVDMPLRPVASRKTIAPLVVPTKSNPVVVMEILLARLGWTNLDESVVSAAPAGLRVNYGRARGSYVVDDANPSHRSFLTERAENAVVWF